MDKNGLISEIFETRYFGTTRSSVPNMFLNCLCFKRKFLFYTCVLLLKLRVETTRSNKRWDMVKMFMYFFLK